MPDPGPGCDGIAARGAGIPRADGDEVEADIPTRAGLVTVEFVGRDYARACPAQRAFTYRGRQYAGTVSLTGPAWRGSALLGLSLYPAGGRAGRGVAEAIASLVAAGVAAWLSDHPEILDQAADARARAERARAQRDLELLTAQIAAAEHELDALRARQDRLQAIAAGSGLAELVRNTGDRGRDGGQ